MAYRGDDAGDALEAPTAEGLLAVVLGPNRVDLSVAQRSLHIADRIATLVEHKKHKPGAPSAGVNPKHSVRISGNLVVARGFPREDVGLWIEHIVPEKPDKKRKQKPEAAPAKARKVEPASTSDTPEPAWPSMQRIFGIQPVSLFERDGLGALSRLDIVAQRLRAHLADFAGSIRRAIEIGSGHDLDKVLLADHGDRYVFYARKLFRGQARFAMAVHADGRLVVPDGKQLRAAVVSPRFGINVRGDYLRFSDRQGVDIAKVSLPWLGPEDRDEIARLITRFIDRDATSP